MEGQWFLSSGYSGTAGYDEEEMTCPPVDQRGSFSADWTCAEYNSFEIARDIYVINGYVVKSLQVIVFICLLFYVSVH